MARFYGKVGFGTPVELVDDVWTDGIVERAYYGDILNETRNLVPGENVNDDIRLTERISIVADAFAYANENYLLIKYVEKAGFLWAVNSVQLERPRLILSLGGIYNGATASD